MDFSHLDQKGQANMVDIGDKDHSRRIARASGFVEMQEDTIRKIRESLVKKGDVLSVAAIAGIMGAKKTPELIPLCHGILLEHVEVTFELDDRGVRIFAEVKTDAKTGVEMEALTAVSVAALTIFDMCKAADKRMGIGQIHVTHKEGGRSGVFDFAEDRP